MPAISPLIASDLAAAAYNIKGSLPKNYHLELAPETEKHFKFNLSEHIYTGTSGGFFCRQATGFVLIGQGYSREHKNDHVIAIRGTDSLADALTDITCHSCNSDNGASVHTGFQSTFASFRSGLMAYFNQAGLFNGNTIVHCVGHSLGGALASLTADWIKTEFKRNVYLYTFGAPRVGKKDYAISNSARVKKMFRCVHGADPVPKMPVWPFYHAPINGHEYILSRAQGIDPKAHFMDGTPGYINTANVNDWESLHCQAACSVSQRVVLNYQNRTETTYSSFWADKIAAALMTLMIDGGAASIIASLQATGATIGTVYDIMARALVDISKIIGMEKQLKGVLGYMLVFAGKSAYIPIEFTYKFIRWVFTVTIGRLQKAAKLALKQSN
ncbi:lipase family protein [Thalassomonas sp. RHCl1]|uniref:lipase family protein n=1 Tax=Thalassomonas sp. RHCl1 TaxID=2995320 RepID=UPI00248BD3F5|nr:lipase family protein [Thalassomonas sp. RHCl1]